MKTFTYLKEKDVWIDENGKHYSSGWVDYARNAMNIPKWKLKLLYKLSKLLNVKSYRIRFEPWNASGIIYDIVNGDRVKKKNIKGRISFRCH